MARLLIRAKKMLARMIAEPRGKLPFFVFSSLSFSFVLIVARELLPQFHLHPLPPFSSSRHPFILCLFSLLSLRFRCARLGFVFARATRTMYGAVISRQRRNTPQIFVDSLSRVFVNERHLFPLFPTCKTAIYRILLLIHSRKILTSFLRKTVRRKRERERDRK